MSGKTAKAARRAAATPGQKKAAPRVQSPKRREAPRSRLKLGVWALLAIPILVGGLYALTALGGKGGGGGNAKATHGSSAYPYAVGSPGVGKPALPLNLPTTGRLGTFNLASYKGKAQVLLYFQEGLTCEPCWTQLKTIQKDLPKFRALGIGPIVSITTDPINLLDQKVSDEGITLPVLSDSDASVSNAWHTNSYQMMMMGNRNGHSFILVGKDGRIRWRADYGGAPKYTMYVPDNVLLAQMRAALKGTA